MLTAQQHFRVDPLSPDGQLMLFDVYAFMDETRSQPVPDRDLVGRFLHLGAGVQSSTLAEMVVEGDLPRVDAVLFADTGNEPYWVYRQVWYLAGRLSAVNIPLIITMQTDTGLVADSMADRTRFVAIPLFTKNPDTGTVGQMRRQCTNEYKIVPNKNWMLDWLVARGHATRYTDKNGVTYRRARRSIYVEDWYGISLDEWDRAGRRGAKWQRAVYPLIDRRWRRVDCIRWLKAHDLPIPKKSLCIVCPYHRDYYWLALEQHDPDLFEEACLYDDWLRTPDARRKVVRKKDQPVYLHESCVPLRDVQFDPSRQPVAMCGDHCMT